MHVADAQSDRLLNVVCAQPVVAVIVKFHRNIARRFQHLRKQLPDARRGQKAPDILEAQAIRFQRGSLAGPFDEIGVGVTGRDRIDQVHHRLDPHSTHLVMLFLERVEIVPGVRNPRCGDACVDDLLQQQLGNRFRHLAKAAAIPGMKPKWRFLGPCGPLPKPFERVFPEVADHFLDLDHGHEEFHRLVARIVQLLERRKHPAGAHVHGPKALLTVPERRVDDLDFVRHLAVSFIRVPEARSLLRPVPATLC